MKLSNCLVDLSPLRRKAEAKSPRRTTVITAYVFIMIIFNG
jgi:hypothetical protein